MSTYSTMAGAAEEHHPEASGVLHWTVDETEQWLRLEGFGDKVVDLLCRKHKIIGKVLLVLNEHDFTVEPLNQLSLTDRKCLYISCKTLQRDNQHILLDLGLIDLPANGAHLVVPSGCGNCTGSSAAYNSSGGGGAAPHHPLAYINPRDMTMMTSAGGAGGGVCSEYCESERVSPPMSYDGRSTRLPPEKLKAFLAFCYVVAVTWITAFVMVIVHERVPDMQKYPPLPDIFLDNVPHIPWAFDMCEVAGTVLFTVWLVVLLFHKHRFILMRRFFALSGTVFLLRCVTMLITSLSVPGQHLKCQPRNFATGSSVFSDLAYKLQQAYFIWRGAGMSIQGVRTCGDYMFSGHTVALTMLNFFITEYTPRYIYYLHTLSWMMNMFGIFFILAAHEHYSIDVFVAFYITSRLFLYYHTLANNQSLILRDYSRTKVWFPLFSYFESGVDGIVPNEYETPAQICWNLVTFVRVKLVALHQLVFAPPNGEIPTTSRPSGAHVFGQQHSTPRRHSRMPSTGLSTACSPMTAPPTPVLRTSNNNNSNKNNSNVVNNSSPPPPPLPPPPPQPPTTNISPSKKKQQ